MSINTVTLMGRLTANPELRTTPNGVTDTPFSIAVERKYYTQNGGRQTDFIECVAWRQTAEFINKYFRKGDMIAVEEDYMSMCRYEMDLATTEAGKRLMRLTKAQMISTIGQCVGIVLAFADLRNQYDTISAAMAVLRHENVAILGTIKEIEKAYERSCDNWNRDAEFDRLLKLLPERVWLE